MHSRAWVTAANRHLEGKDRTRIYSQHKNPCRSPPRTCWYHLIPEAEGVKDSDSLPKSDADDSLVDADVGHLTAELDMVDLGGRGVIEEL